MNIILREIRSNLKSLIIWIGSLFAFLLAMTSEFSAYYDNPEMADVLEAMPKELMKAFSLESANLTTVSGYMSIASTYFILMLGIYAGLLGSSIISKEERDKTAEFLMSLPISRIRIITSKLIAAVMLCLVIDVALIAEIYITTMKYDKLPIFNKYMWLSGLSMFIIEMIFLSMGMMIASVMKRYRRSGSYSIAIIVIMYFLSIMVALSDKIEKLKYLTPFKYFESSRILMELKVNSTYVIISIGIIIVSIAVTYLAYPKRDMNF